MDFSSDLDSQLNLASFSGLPCLGVVDGVLAGEVSAASQSLQICFICWMQKISMK